MSLVISLPPWHMDMTAMTLAEGIKAYLNSLAMETLVSFDKENIRKLCKTVISSHALPAALC